VVPGHAYVSTKIYAQKIFFLQKTSRTILMEDDNDEDDDDNVLQTPKIQRRIRTTMGE